jgi:thiamine-phosphate pyrophosphorylase
MYPYEKLIAVTDRSLCRGDFLTQIKKITSLHPDSLILRERDLPDGEYLLLARQVQAICENAAEKKVPFFVHSRIEIAREIGCPNLHLPLPALAALGTRPEGFACVSTSAHSMEDMEQAVALGADRIILGTIFETQCKKGLRGRGLSFVGEICAACPIPVFAIGGIKETNIEAVIAAGAAGGCMMSGFMQF